MTCTGRKQSSWKQQIKQRCPRGKGWEKEGIGKERDEIREGSDKGGMGKGRERRREGWEKGGKEEGMGGGGIARRTKREGKELLE